MPELLQGFRRCWLRALTLGVLCAAAVAAAVWFGLPPSKARARTLLYVAPEQPHVAFPDPQSRLDFLGFKKTQVALVKSRMVLNAALKQPKIAENRLVRQQADPVQWLEEQLVVDYSTGPDILTIALYGYDKGDMVAIVNAVANAYLEEIVEKEHNKRLERLDQLKAIQSNYEERLRDKRRTLKDLAEAAGTADPTNLALKQRIALEQLAATQKELTQMQSDVRKLQVESALEADHVKKAAEAEVPEAAIDEQIRKDPLVQGYQARITQFQAELDEIQRVNPSHFREIGRKTQDEMDSVKKELKEHREKVRPQVEADLRDRARIEMQNKVSQQKERLAFLKSLESQLNKDVGQMEKDSGLLTRHGLDLESIRDEISQADKTLQQISGQAEAMNVERDAKPRVRTLEEGFASQPDQRKRQIMASVGGGLGGLALVVFGLCWWECRSLRISSADEVVRGLGMTVMGTLPLMPSRAPRLGWSGSPGQAEWKHVLLESVDSIRTMLLHLARTADLRVVMVTSAVSGEGKTSLSCHLATSLARAGRRTLLIDADLRKPSLHRIFDRPGGAGVCELLRGDATPAEAVQPTEVNGLWLLGAGTCDEAALAALSQGGAGPILAGLKAAYDFVVVDSSPVLPVTDSLLVAQEADGVLFSVLRDVSRLGRVYAAYERLALFGVRVLGAVVTGARPAEVYAYEYRYANTSPEEASDSSAAEEEAE